MIEQLPDAFNGQNLHHYVHFLVNQVTYKAKPHTGWLAATLLAQSTVVKQQTKKKLALHKSNCETNDCVFSMTVYLQNCNFPATLVALLLLLFVDSTMKSQDTIGGDVINVTRKCNHPVILVEQLLSKGLSMTVYLQKCNQPAILVALLLMNSCGIFDGSLRHEQVVILVVML